MKEQIIEFFTSGSWIKIAVPFLINVAIALAILIVGIWIAGHLTRLFDKLMRIRHIDDVLRGFLVAALSTLLKFIVALISIEQLGINTTSLLALMAAAGLAVSLALKDSLSNFVSGVMLVLFKPFKVGDYVEAAGTAGICESISAFSSVFKSPDNKKIIVPNSRIFTGTIVNHSANSIRRIDLELNIGYGEDLKNVQDLLWQVLKSDQRVLKEPAPVVAINQLGNTNVNFIIQPWVITSNYSETRWSLLKIFKTIFDENGVPFK